MAAPIVYEGAAGGPGGTLFKDIKFWVAHRVPMRSTWIQNIESNGGSVEKLEKRADYLIADHARTDTPAGSYSWRWIEESVKAGKLLDAKDYSINKAVSESRPVGSVQQKSTRTAFTKEDDQILAQWVTRYERQGFATQGNKIYNELETKYPHHTFQSWRDRWVKKLQHLPRPELTHDELALPEPEEDTTAVAHAATPPPPRAAPRGAAPRASKARSVSASPGSVKATRTRFTKEEDEVLIDYVKESQLEGKNIGGNIMWKDFAEDFPQHPWQSWRDRWLKQLKRSTKSHNEDDEKTRPVTISRAEKVRRAAQARIAALEAVQEDVPSPPPFRGATVNEAAQSPIADEIEVKIPQADMKRDPADSVDEELAHSEGQDPSEAGMGSPSHGSDRLQNSPQQPPPSSAGQNNAVPSSPTAVDSEDKRRFYRDLQDYLDVQTQTDQPFPMWPTIKGHAFEIWDLWRVTIAQKVEPAERDWQLVAEELGYNWIELPTVPEEIRRCYETNLSQFEDVMIRFDEDSDEDENEQEPDTPMREPRSRGLDEFSQAPYNSSPPLQPSLKRRFESTLLSDHIYPESARKRPKVSMDTEIPSTPEHRNGTFHLRNPVSAAVSPSDKRRSALPKSSKAAPGKGKQVANEEDEMEDQVPELPVLTTPKRAGIEPETQDFPFDPHTQNMFATQMDDIQESQVDMTPSQQLHSEASQRIHLEATPTPKRNVKSPFLMNDDDDDDDEDVGNVEEPTPKPRYGKGPNPLLANPDLIKAKRRSLPASYMRGTQPAATQRRSMPGPSNPATKHSSPPDKATPPEPQLHSKAKELSIAVEYWMSLGYTQQTARQSLEATTWEPGLAGRVMQLLKNGDPMPKNWEGVWTQRDDEGLALIDSAEPPKDDKELRKRKRTTERLINKHGEERIVLRRKWMATKAML